MDNNDIKNLEVLNEIIESGDILVDVGANKGDYTEYFKKKLNNTGKIYSIELHPNTFSSLKNRFINNNNIITVNAAISNTDGTIDYFAGVDSCTNNIIGHDMSFKKNNKEGEIQSIKLETLLKDEEKIKLIKIDVEGAEDLVLEGMIGLKNKVQYILIECHLDEFWEKIKNLLLVEFSYHCYNVLTREIIKNDSSRAYQCFCKKRTE